MKKETQRQRDLRMRWWREARFGMFIHWGLYSQVGRAEWILHNEAIPPKEYELLARTWKPKTRPAREWARLAKQAGMKYMVMTTKHHEGFCLWDSKQTYYNAVNFGPKRDLVREYVEACREFGLKVGLYYSLLDWHHPDSRQSMKDKNAKRRFLDFTQGCVRELCTKYGKIDILWYDIAYPGGTPEWWESDKMNGMVRKLQPGIIINNRARDGGDFGTPEESINPGEKGKDWEACMTFNGTWGYMPTAIDWLPVRNVLEMIRTVAAGEGNLLLNIGPKADGSVPEEAVERLTDVGKWLKSNGEAVYGKVKRTYGIIPRLNTGNWTIKGNNAYYWCYRWPGDCLYLGRFIGKVKKITLLATGQKMDFKQEPYRVVVKLPKANPDKIAGIFVLKLECEPGFREVVPCNPMAIG